MQSETLLLRRSEIERVVSLKECIDAVEEVFRLRGNGQIPAAGILGVKATNGSLHVKAALLPRDKNYIVAKLNTNFSGNRAQSGLPTIQGVIVLYDGENGCPLAVLDSTDITIKRTAAASAVAAKYLARPNSFVGTICGCGQQGRAHVRALQEVLPLEKIYAFDLDNQAARDLATELAAELDLQIKPAGDLQQAIQESDVCVTCTPSRQFFIRREDVSPGTFIAAVGADNEDKQEIDPELMALSKVIVDSVEQCSTIGDLHHAISAGLMQPEDVHAELAEVVTGQKAGRISADEIIIFDSTGVAIEDAISAIAVYQKACSARIGSYFDFAT